MIEAQIISKILEEENIDILLNENITSEYFITYSEEAIFLFNHYNEYRKVPTKETFIGKFNEFELTSAKEDWNYLITALRENYMFNQLAILFNSSTKEIENNALIGYQLVKNKIAELENIKPITSNDIVKNADKRFEEYKRRMDNESNQVIKIGLKEMDDKLFGWNMGEELVTIMARTNQGKSWLLLEFLINAWKQGKNVGLYSGEMSAEQVGYRFDALYKHFSNLNLMRSNKEEEKEYEKYIEELKEAKNNFIVITPKDLGHLANVNDIDYMIKKYNLDIVGIDQYSLMDDYRSKKGDPLRIRLGNISADLFNLSMKYKIPILALSQANRAASKNGNPELEHISESDAIAQNSTKVISISRRNEELSLQVIKNRYGMVGDEFIYLWDIDKGEFKFSRYGSEKTNSYSNNNTELSRRNVVNEESPF